MSLALLGSGTFQDLYAPVKGKSEWGLDTLTRRLSGARSLLEAFIATLAQGQIYPPGAPLNQAYFLQTWGSDESPDVATITLNYKGFVTGGTPEPKPSTRIVTTVGQTERDFSTEGIVNGVAQGRFYRRDLIWSVGSATTVGDPFGVTAQGFRDRYALTARMEFTYRAIQTTYRYFTIGKPFGPRYIYPDIIYPPIIDRARITLNDGTVLPQINWQVFFGLTPISIDKNISFECDEVTGSPYFECTDIAQRTLGDS